MKNSKLISKAKNLIPKTKIGFLFLYTAIVAAMAICIYIVFVTSGKGFVWLGPGSKDGYTQHYLAFMYFGQWGREIITTLFTEGRLVIPMWDFSIGYGSDIVTSMHYYSFGDPLNLLSILTPSKYSEILYELLIFARMYLSGLAFCALAFNFSKRRSAVLGGAIAYIFCGYTIFTAVRHPFFMNPMIYLPLVILGAEKILRKQSPLLFVFMIFITTTSNFYFLYMTAIAVVLYVVIRYFTMNNQDKTNMLSKPLNSTTVAYEKNIKDFSFTVLKFALSAILGIGMACFLFLPVVNVLFASNRLTQPSELPDLFYNLHYYETFVTSMFADASPEQWTSLGFAAPIFAAIVVMFMNRKKYIGLKIGFIIMVVMLSLPIFGKVMNGFSYVSNRWCFIFSLLVAFIIVAVWEDMLSLSKKQVGGLFICSTIYFAVILLSKPSEPNALIAMVLIYATIVLLILNYTGSFKLLTKRTVSILLVCLIGTSCISIGKDKNKTYVKEFLSFNQALIDVENSSDKELSKITKKESSFVRTLSDKTTDLNSSVITGNHNTQFYWSLESGAVSSFLKENSLCNFYPQKYDGLNNRTYLSAISSVKYYSQSKNAAAPYGYEKIKKTKAAKKPVTIFENKNPLPLGYTYSEYITKDDYLKMSAAEKQQAMIQGVVIDTEENPDLTSYKKAEPIFTHQVINSEIKCGNKVVMEKDGSFVVNKNKGKLEIIFDGLENSEIYLHVKVNSADTKNKYELYMDNCEEYYSRKEFESLSKSRQKSLRKSDFFDRETKADKKLLFKVKAENEAPWQMSYCTEDFRYSTGQKDYLVNVGYSKEGKNKIEFTFPQAGVYKFDTIEVICQPMDDFDAKINALKEDVMINEVIDTNSVSGDITIDEDKILALSIPYSRGWSATVDGEEVELLQANSMYMAIPLKAGKHHIQLNYSTPLGKIGAIVSFVSFVIFAALLTATSVANKKKKKRGVTSYKV